MWTPKWTPKFLRKLRYLLLLKPKNKPNMERIVFLWHFTYLVNIVHKTKNGHTMYEFKWY